MQKQLNFICKVKTIFVEICSRKIVAVAGTAAAGKKLQHPGIGNWKTNLKHGLTLRLRLPFVGNWASF